MNIKSAIFVKSSPNISNCPDDGKPEYAFIGRSNVGKSSLINMLTNKKGLALTSSTPGKTLLINYFLINDSWYIVDLPGYGFAKISKVERLKLLDMINSYILKRAELVNLFVLIDIRHSPQEIDLDFMMMLAENNIAFSIVFTKSDKLSKSNLAKNVESYKSKLYEFWEELPPVFITSSVGKMGKENILNYIEEINSEIL